MTRADGWLIAIVVAFGLVLQGWLFQAHWVDPDEGAHLMDARLAMDGLVPEVDFQARQPLYVYTYVPALWAFGERLWAGRLMPLLATLAGGAVLYALGRRLWGRREGLCAAALYLTAPCVFVDAHIVQTEPLTILLMGLGLWGVVAHLQTGRWGVLWWSGVALGVGYYVRESSLVACTAAVVLIVTRVREGRLLFWRRVAVLMLSYAAVCATMMLWLLLRWTPAQLWARPDLVPLLDVWRGLGRIVCGTVGGGVSHSGHQPWSETGAALVHALRINAVYLTAGVLATGYWLRRLVVPRTNGATTGQPHQTEGMTLAIAWAGSALLLYAYYALRQAFYPSYAREFIPPLALAMAPLLAGALGNLGWERYWARLLPLLLLVGAAVFWWERGRYGSGLFIALPLIGLLGWLVFGRYLSGVRRRLVYLAVIGGIVAVLAAVRVADVAGGLRQVASGWFSALGIVAVLALVRGLAGRLEARRAWGFVVIAAVTAAGVSTASHAARLFDVTYDGVWSPRTVASVARVVEAHTEPGDEVLSGGVIWEFEAHRRPFCAISHPLRFEFALDAETAAQIARGLREWPPRVIILDGVTERTYLRHVEDLAPLLASSYQPIWATADGVAQPVTVYLLNKERRSAVAAGGGRCRG